MARCHERHPAAGDSLRAIYQPVKANSSPHRLRALTRNEVLIVVAMLAVLAVVFLPMTARSKESARQKQCMAHLKQVGLGFFSWALDSGVDALPWMTSSNGGTQKFVESTNVFLHFRAISNELNTPTILVCPSDSDKTPANDFNKFDNRNLSYFINLDPMGNGSCSFSDVAPRRLLSGDRNLTTNGVALGSGVFTLTGRDTLGWNTAIHKIGPNLLCLDGSVPQMSVQDLQKQWLGETNTILRLSVP